MQKFKKKKKDIIKTGTIYLGGGLGATFLGIILLLSCFSILDYIVREESPSIIILYSSIVVSFFFGIFYFFWGLVKLRYIFRQNKPIFLFGVISYVSSIPSFLYGTLSPLECYPSGCIWDFSMIETGLLSLGIILFILCLIFFMIIYRKIKGKSIDYNISKKEEEIPSTSGRKTLYRILLDENDKVCGNCGAKNRFKILDEEIGLFRCLKCDSENYLHK